MEMIDRDGDVAHVLSCVVQAECCSILGVSNIGKSTLMRAIALPAVHGPPGEGRTPPCTFVYVDFNLTSQLSEQGFYEVILRNMQQALETRGADGELRTIVRQAYQTVISPSSPFLIPLAFENCLESIHARHTDTLVLLFDEFDEVFAAIEPRVFVRLRAWKDRYGGQLCYVTATGRPLPEIRPEREVGEFCELFAAHVHHIGPLDEEHARRLLQQRVTGSGEQVTPEDVDFLLSCAGGHPGLLLASAHVLTRAKEEALWRPAAVHYAHIREELDSDANVRLECAKLWNDLTIREQDALIALLGAKALDAPLDSLAEKGIVRVSSDGGRVFAELFAGFAVRQQLVRRPGPRGVRIDVEAGDVWVDGKIAPILTDLEYKLMLLLYGNLDKICDKYRIVESVWGENYIDEVDDARIEKLVSRLRDKIEPDPAAPKYLLTIRGRGYKLVSPE